MKRIVLFITAVLLFAGCAKEQLVEERSYTGPVTVVSATFESLSNGATKADVTDAGIFTWQNGDKAAFTAASGSSYYTGTNSSTSATASFSISENLVFTSNSFAFFPSDLTTGKSTSSLDVTVPATREWVKDQTNVAMYGVKVENEASFNFSHMGGLVKVRVNNVPTNARKFVFKTPDYKISGDFTAVEESGFKVIKTKKHETENPVPESEQTYTLYWETAPNAENTMDFYIPLPLGTYANGFAFKFLDGTDAEILSKTSSQSETIARKDLVLMPAITLMGGEIETAEKAAVVANIPAGYSGDFLLPQSEKVLLKINAPTGTADYDITLKYDGANNIPTNLEVKVVDGENAGNYNAKLLGTLPSTHVEFRQGHIDATELTTSSSTFAVINPATIGTLTVMGGNVKIEGATVTSIVVDENAVASEETKAPVQIVVEKSDAQEFTAPAVTAKANVIVAPAQGVTVNVTADDDVKVASEGAGKVQNGSGQDIDTKAAAQIGTAKYITLADAVAAVPTDGTETTITMIANHAVDVATSGTITIPSSKNIILDLNGKEVAGVCSSGNSSALFENKGTLKIVDNAATKGQITYGATPSWIYQGELEFTGSYASNIITNRGDLIIDGAYLDNQANGSACLVIDTYDSGTVTVEKGYLKAANSAVRMFYGSGSKFIFKDGTIDAGRFSINSMFNKDSEHHIEIKGGNILTSDADKININTWSGDSENNTKCSLAIDGGTFNGVVSQYRIENVTVNGGYFHAYCSYVDSSKPIKGGYYTNNIYSDGEGTYTLADYVADGYAVVMNTDDATKDTYHWTVQENASELINTQDEFVAACAAAKSGDKIVLGNGNFAITSSTVGNKELAFTGQGEHTIIRIGNADGDGNQGTGTCNNSTKLSFENLSLTLLEGKEDANYTGFTAEGELYFKNVKFLTGFSNWGNQGKNVTFVDCTFNQHDDSRYCVQELRSGDKTKFLFDNCQFICTGEGRFINAYKQGGENVSIEIVVKDCTFDGSQSTQKKAAVNLKSGYSDGCNIKLYLLGNNATNNVANGAKTGNPLFDDNDTHATVYQGTDENSASIIWQNGAKVE